jgi:NADH-quinone oxidoreductase subunit C
MSDPVDDTTDAAEDAVVEGAGVEPAEIHGCPVSESCGQLVVYPGRDDYVDVVKALADDGYAMCVDLTAVDYVDHISRALPDGIEASRFEVVVNLLDITNRRRIRLRVQVPGDEPVIASLFDIHPGSEAMEREVFDMFGIEFSDHPDPSRILMPEDWIGHPLRKDYEIGKIPVQFKGSHS